MSLFGRAYDCSVVFACSPDRLCPLWIKKKKKKEEVFWHQSKQINKNFRARLLSTAVFLVAVTPSGRRLVFSKTGLLAQQVWASRAPLSFKSRHI